MSGKAKGSEAPAAGSAEEIITSCEVGKDYLGNEPYDDEGLTCFDCARLAVRSAEAAAEARRDAAWRKALRRYEWLPDSDGNLCCPECFGHAFHEPACALRALLGSAATAPTAPPGSLLGASDPAEGK